MRRNRQGLSMAELVAAVAILTLVVSLGVLQFGKTTTRANAKLDEQRRAALTRACQSYYANRGEWPDKNLIYLTYYGYAGESSKGFPYFQYASNGEIYKWNAATETIERGAAPR